MPDSITPALTPDEWEARRIEPTSTERFGVHDDGDGIEFFATNDDGSLLGKWKIDSWDQAGAHAVAALLLHGQPFGFTWEMVDALRACLHFPEAGEDEDIVAQYEQAYAAVDRIAALLPPRQGER